MNKLTLDLADNDELKTALSGKEPGDRVTLTVEVMVTDANDQMFEGDIESILTDGMEEDDEGEVEEIKPDKTSPVMIVMGPKDADEEDEDSETSKA